MKGKKTGGRKKGVQNRVNRTTKEWIAAIIDENRKQIETDLLSLEPKDRVAAITKLMEFVVAKASSNMNIQFERLEESQLDEIVNELSIQLKK